MIYVISGTNRPASRSREVSDWVADNMKKYTRDVEVIDLADLPLHELIGDHYDKNTDLPSPIRKTIDKINHSDGLVLVVPEYNGSFPGSLKYFIDFWSYPKSFEYRPVAFIGLGYRWGGLRPVEQMQQIFNYRNAFIFPERVFLTNIEDVLKNKKIADKDIKKLLDRQARNFVKFINGLKTQDFTSSP